MKVVPLNIGIQIDCDIRNLTEQDYKDINDLYIRDINSKYVFIKGSRSLQLETILDIR